MKKTLRLLGSSLFLTTFLFVTACETTAASHRRGKIAEGAWVATLPSGYKVTNISGITYYTHGGNFFVRKGNRFVAVGSPHSTLNEKQDLSTPL